MSVLSDSAVEDQLQTLTGWHRSGNAIEKEFTLGSFPDAVAFVVRLAFEAESADHHPDVLIRYKRVTLTYATHSEGGITQKDFDGARIADRCAS